MRRALELAARGEGLVEPNPMVGALVVGSELRLLGEGFHERFGGPHAEINALQQAGDAARGSTLFVTLEPCGHHGKTPPCVDAVIQSGISRVVVGARDPNPQVAGEGIARLRAAGIVVDTGLLREECERLIAPFAKWVTSGLPWVHAKWAMTLDGRIATRTGRSQWISNPLSRELAHRLRGRMDAVIVGAETAARDDPQLTARPPGPRTAVRVVVSRSGRLNPESQLVRTARDVPVLATALDGANVPDEVELQSQGVEIVRLPAAEGGRRKAEGGGRKAENGPPTSDLRPPASDLRPPASDLRELLRLLGEGDATNVLVEGGGRLLGSLFDAGLIDEFHVFVAPKLAGGAGAVSPLEGLGRDAIAEWPDLTDATVEILDGDVYIRGRVAPKQPPR
jgi:diaminohydroxyphosphoribosylaminopyrimidine deaminase/5-amino-6-(5-phosphoribosylamino)uracil reductase